MGKKKEEGAGQNTSNNYNFIPKFSVRVYTEMYKKKS
jgi:hypothetical protein